MTLEQRKARIAEIQSQQLALLSRTIEIAKKLEKKSVKAAIDSAIAMVTLGLEIRMLEAEKQVILSQPLPRYPLPGRGNIVVVRADGTEFIDTPGRTGEIEMKTKAFEMDVLILKNRYGGLNPREEESMRAVFNAKMDAIKCFSALQINKSNPAHTEP